ncbi:MAG: tripartite tricarboxylate transporter substrate-binding protein [Pseudorhodoplanes sp.]
MPARRHSLRCQRDNPASGGGSLRHRWAHLTIAAAKLRGLAVTSDDRWPELPDIPTLRESKFEGIPALLWSGLLAPSQAPTAVIDKLNAAMINAMKTPAAQAGLTKLGPRRSSTPCWRTRPASGKPPSGQPT